MFCFEFHRNAIKCRRQFCPCHTCHTIDADRHDIIYCQQCTKIPQRWLLSFSSGSIDDGEIHSPVVKGFALLNTCLLWVSRYSTYISCISSIIIPSDGNFLISVSSYSDELWSPNILPASDSRRMILKNILKAYSSRFRFFCVNIRSIGEPPGYLSHSLYLEEQTYINNTNRFTDKMVDSSHTHNILCMCR